MPEADFYWEFKGEDYPFDPYKKYLIYFKGCYCMPHAGHYNTVKRFTDLIEDGINIRVMVHQMGSSRRHGVPYNLNRYIFQKYIDELLPSDRVHLVKYRSGIHEILNLDFIDDIDTVIYIRGNEDYNVRKTEKKNRYAYQSIIKSLSRKEINMDFYYLERPHVHKLSATKFTRSLIKTRRNCKKHGCDCKYRKLRYFLPDGLERDVSMKIIRKLQRCKLYE